MNINVEL